MDKEIFVGGQYGGVIERLKRVMVLSMRPWVQCRKPYAVLYSFALLNIGTIVPGKR